MVKKNKYSDLNNREEQYEKQGKTLGLLKEGWKAMQKEAVAGYSSAPRANGENIGAQLSNHVKPFREAEVPPVEDAPIEDAPVDDIPPEPISVDEPEDGGEMDSVEAQANAKTEEFISKALSNLPSDATLEPANGAYMGDVQDEHLGAFTVVVYPKDTFTSLHDLANAVEPEGVAGPEAPDVALDVDGGDELDMGDPSAESPLDMGDEVAPEEEPVVDPVEDEELAESDDKDCDDEEVMMEEEEGDDEDDEDEEDEDCDEEQKLDESRDPASCGKKDWKAFMESRYIRDRE